MTIFTNRTRRQYLWRSLVGKTVAVVEAVLAFGAVLAVFACWGIATYQDEHDFASAKCISGSRQTHCQAMQTQGVTKGK